jgi:hypothetical protein
MDRLLLLVTPALMTVFITAAAQAVLLGLLALADVLLPRVRSLLLLLLLGLLCWCWSTRALQAAGAQPAVQGYASWPSIGGGNCGDQYSLQDVPAPC